MNQFKPIRIFSLVLLFLLAGCQASGDNKAAQNTTASPVTDPAVLYEEAADKIHASEHLSYYIATNQTIHVADQTFTRNSQQRLNIQDPGKETMRSSMAESLQIGSFTVEISEIYESGNGYVTIDGNAFTAPLSAEEISHRYTPAVCFDPILYNKLECVPQDNRIRISFSEPKAAESWALPKDAVFADASGYAELNEDGILQESIYTISYTVGNISVSQSTRITMMEYSDVSSPSSPDTYTPIEYFDGPRMLEQACGYLQQAENVVSSAETEINCQTFSINRKQTSNVLLSGNGDNFNAKLDIQINQTNQSRGGETTDIHQIETFQNGIYSISINNAEATQNDAIDAAAMKTYCQDILIRDILMPQHISGVTSETTDLEQILSFQASNSFAEATCSNICSLLYSDAELLHTLSSSYETQSVQCVLRLDRCTGLPLFFTSQYSALHNIEEISYLLESKTEQSYQYEITSGQ